MPAPFVPTRQAGLAALASFIPEAGRHYAESRNHDLGPGHRSNVSMLSPYLRHRLITEREVVESVLEAHSLAAAEKFVHEVFWRTYWKGWLQLRPAVWRRYRGEVAGLLDQSATAPWSEDLATALAGATGIDCFDAWVAELAANGYLHNHTRMWFASIWIFTLGLPWQLGADLFYRQLIDGDAASNTLSWRWVAGLQTPGKTYLATAANIARYTEGRFSPRGLATHARALSEDGIPEPAVLHDLPALPRGTAGLLLHEDDLNPESLDLDGVDVVCVAGAHAAARRSPGLVSSDVDSFTTGALAEAVTRAAAHLGGDAGPLSGDILNDLGADAVQRWAQEWGLTTIVTARAPVGPAGEAITELTGTLAREGIRVVTVGRRWDSLAWPHARRGFFSFRERIPTLLSDQGIGVHR